CSGDWSSDGCSSDLAIGPDDVDAAVDFLRALKDLRAASGSGSLPDASEACFAVAGIVASVDRRADRLARASERHDEIAVLRRWLDGRFAPLREEIGDWCRRTAAGEGVPFDLETGPAARTLSP